MFFSTIKVPSTYHLVDNLKKLDWVIDELLKSKIFSFDIETNYPTAKIKVERDYPEVVCGISFSWGRTGVEIPWIPGTAAYIPLTKADDSPYWRSNQEYVYKRLREVLESDIPKVAQNGKFDISKLFSLLDIRTRAFSFDTMLAHSLLDEDRKTSSHALKSDFDEAGNIIKLGMSDAYLDTSSSQFKEELTDTLIYYDPHFRRYSKVPIDVLYPYGCADADLTLSLMYIFLPLIEAEGMTWLFTNVVMPLCHTLVSLESYGMPLDIERAKRVVEEQTAIMSESEKEVWSIIGREFNVGSNDQLGSVLFEELGLPGEKGEHHKWKVDVENLSSIQHPIIEPVLKYRRAQKIGSTYAQSSLDLVRDVTEAGDIGWVHVNYFQDSLTGRLRCTAPNLSNTPRPENGGLIVKGLYKVPDGYKFIFKDYSQIELRIAAHLASEPVWIQAINQGVDLHNLMAWKINNLPCDVSEVKKLYPELRTAAKSVGFGLLYGLSEFSLSKQLNISYEEACKLVHEDYFGAVPTLRQWIEDVHTFVQQNGYVTNMFGRRRHMPEAMMEIPQSLKWPDDSVRPECYRKGPYASWLGVDFYDIYDMADFQVKQLIKNKGHLNQYSHCLSCPYVLSCIINREVKFAKAKLSRILRQAVNMPVQSSAADLSFLAFNAMADEFKAQNMDTHVVLHVHDELVVIARDDEIEKANKIMDYYMIEWLKDYVNLSVPLEVDTEIVSRWSDKYESED